MRMPRRARFLVLLVGAGVALGAIGGVTYGAFFSTTSNSGNSFSAAADWTAPSASASVIAGTAIGSPVGIISPGQSYYVYALVADSGNPASGTKTVTANVSTITAGQTAAPLTSGSYTAGSVTYNFRSAATTADAGLSAGTYSYSLTLTDNALNSATQTGFSVTVSSFRGTDIQTSNGGATAGQLENGDSVTYTFSAQASPASILSGWTGAATAVQINISNNGCGTGNDQLTILSTGGATLPLGTVCLIANYVNGNKKYPATMVQSGASITVTAGTVNGGVNTVTTATTMTWTPSSLATDLFGNGCSTATVTESGAADVEF